MVAVARREDLIDEDQRVILCGMPWHTFEAMLALRGDASGVRMYYLDGEIELVSPTRMHEDRKKTFARLLELWALEAEVDLNGLGSWTLKREMKDAGAEPDECYILGSPDARDVPDIAIEVEWSRKTGLPKEEIYLRLGVRELWTLKADGSLLVRVTENGQWVTTTQSRLLPQLDLTWLVQFLDVTPQSAAVRSLRDALRNAGAR